MRNHLALADIITKHFVELCKGNLVCNFRVKGMILTVATTFCPDFPTGRNVGRNVKACNTLLHTQTDRQADTDL